MQERGRRFARERFGRAQAPSEVAARLLRLRETARGLDALADDLQARDVNDGPRHNRQVPVRVAEGGFFAS